MEKLFGALILIFGALAFMVFISFLLSWPVYALWNGCLVDAVTGIKEVTWMQAWGINILSGILFKTTVNKS
jgi:hypothetical protein